MGGGFGGGSDGGGSGKTAGVAEAMLRIQELLAHIPRALEAHLARIQPRRRKWRARGAHRPAQEGKRCSTPSSARAPCSRLEGAGDDARAQIDLPRHGTKWLALSVAKLNAGTLTLGDPR